MTNEELLRRGLSAKVAEIRQQMTCNVETIKRSHPDPEPRILPHVIETLTDHLENRLRELEELHETATRLRAGEGVMVKPLIWERTDSGYDYAKTPFVGDYYTVWTEGSEARGCWSKMQSGINRVDGGRDDAKAAAQADYEARIMSALTPKPRATRQPDEVTEAMVVAAAKGAIAELEDLAKEFRLPFSYVDTISVSNYRVMRAALTAAMQAKSQPTTGPDEIGKEGV